MFEFGEAGGHGVEVSLGSSDYSGTNFGKLLLKSDRIFGLLPWGSVPGYNVSDLIRVVRGPRYNGRQARFVVFASIFITV